MNTLQSFMITIVALLRLKIFRQKNQLSGREKMKLLFILDNQIDVSDFTFKGIPFKTDF